MAIALEVIVTSVQEAIEAELGGADRLELVDALEHGGLTPSLEIVGEVVRAVAIPVRVMLRENASMSIADAEIARLRSCAARLGELAIDGLVVGFNNNDDLDIEATREILAGAPGKAATFHRAFDHATDKLRALERLKQVSQIDRVLTDGGKGSWNERMLRVTEWQRVAAPIKLIFATGIDISGLPELADQHDISEVHIGRAARFPQATSGAVNRAQVAELKRSLR